MSDAAITAEIQRSVAEVDVYIAGLQKLRCKLQAMQDKMEKPPTPKQQEAAKVKAETSLRFQKKIQRKISK